jgi:hypothetical protein
MQMDNLDRAFETVKQKLYGRLHDILRKQIVERVPMQGASRTKSTSSGSYLPDKKNMKQLATLTTPGINFSEAVTVPSTR